MLLLEGYKYFKFYVRYYFPHVEFCDFYVNQSLAGQTIPLLPLSFYKILQSNQVFEKNPSTKYL
jgi:hypothetical protein